MAVCGVVKGHDCCWEGGGIVGGYGCEVGGNAAGVVGGGDPDVSPVMLSFMGDLGEGQNGDGDNCLGCD